MTCCNVPVQSPSDVMDFSMVAEVLDAEESTAGVSGEQLYVHAPNPVRSQLLTSAFGSSWYVTSIPMSSPLKEYSDAHPAPLPKASGPLAGFLCLMALLVPAGV